MKAAGSRRDRIRAQLADLKMPGALEAVDDVLTRVDGGGRNGLRSHRATPRCSDHAA